MIKKGKDGPYQEMTFIESMLFWGEGGGAQRRRFRQGRYFPP